MELVAMSYSTIKNQLALDPFDLNLTVTEISKDISKLSNELKI